MQSERNPVPKAFYILHGLQVTDTVMQRTQVIHVTKGEGANERMLNDILAHTHRKSRRMKSTESASAGKEYADTSKGPNSLNCRTRYQKALTYVILSRGTSKYMK